MSSKLIVQIDMDNVIADFIKAINGKPGVYINDPPEMLERGFFRTLPLVPGTKKFIHELYEIEHVDLHICSMITDKNLYCATEKLEWITIHFPFLLKKTTLTFDKALVNGHFLIDDDASQWHNKFKGIFVWFDYSNPIESQKKIIKYFKSIALENEDVKFYKKSN